jgi:hypothetical protein
MFRACCLSVIEKKSMTNIRTYLGMYQTQNFWVLGFGIWVSFGFGCFGFWVSFGFRCFGFWVSFGFGGFGFCIGIWVLLELKTPNPNTKPKTTKPKTDPKPKSFG